MTEPKRIGEHLAAARLRAENAEAEVDRLRESHRDCQRTFDELEAHYRAERKRQAMKFGDLGELLRRLRAVGVAEVWQDEHTFCMRMDDGRRISWCRR